ncbi:MAG: outer membrane protein transport protein [Candidatus Latescibacteria bacterium]|nr:outer membrane protein transport protein [Candidatus Latescibacterota bacterium]MDP7447122.1 outer membrane protein transport protein [Candidatus Latescibacterota bacterium]HJP29836.1 outer membrane protein transport protein [Candidatus Latescibacterota bacterium]
MKWPLMTFLVLLLAAAAVAQEESAIDNFAGLGVRAMGMGGAYTGVADDFTAVFWNPAGLAQMRRREVYVAFLRNAKQNVATAGRGTAVAASATADVSNTRFGSLGFVYPYPVYRGAFVLAAGFNRVKDFDWGLQLPTFAVQRDGSGSVIGDSLAFEDSFFREGELAVTTIAAAVDVTPSMSLGLTLNLISGENETESTFVSIDTEDLFLERRFVDKEFFIDDYETTWTATLGAMMHSSEEDPRFRLGATITTGPTHKVSFTYRAPPDTAFTRVEFDDGRVESARSSDFDSSYKIDLPLSFGIGASYRPAPQVLLAASVQATEWSQTEYADGDAFELRTNTSFEDQYDDILSYHLGVEWQVPWLALDLRAGTYTDPLPFTGPRDPNRVADPVTNPVIRILQDRRFWTLGAGLVLDETVRADLAYNHGSYEQAEGLAEAELREDVSIDRLFLGVAYQF